MIVSHLSGSQDGGLEDVCQEIWSGPSGLDNGQQVDVFMSSSESNQVN